MSWANAQAAIRALEQSVKGGDECKIFAGRLKGFAEMRRKGEALIDDGERVTIATITELELAQ